MVVLNELREGLLQDVGPVLEVWKRVEHLPVEAVEGGLPCGVESGDDSADQLLISHEIGAGSSGLPVLQRDLGLFDEFDLKKNVESLSQSKK